MYVYMHMHIYIYVSAPTIHCASYLCSLALVKENSSDGSELRFLKLSQDKLKIFRVKLIRAGNLNFRAETDLDFVLIYSYLAPISFFVVTNLPNLPNTQPLLQKRIR